MKKENIPYFILSILVIAFAFGMMWTFFLKGDYEQGKILETGIPAKAVVLDIKSTGVIVNSQPKARLFLKIYPATGEAYETQLEMVISPVYLPQFQPGAKLSIKVDRKDRKKVAVDKVIR